MISAVLKVFAALFVVVAARVSAQTHHVLGGDAGFGPALDVESWLSGRVFKIGDKISFNLAGTEDNIVELMGPDEFHSCDLTNPIKMYTDPLTHVELEKEGTRYFTSTNPESCKNGLKLPVSVQSHEYGPPDHEHGSPAHEYEPPAHEHEPFPPLEPPPHFAPPEPEHPPPAHGPPPPHFAPPEPEPVHPPPAHGPPPPHHAPPEPVRPPPAFGPPPPRPSAATYLYVPSLVLFVGLLISCLSM